VEGIGKSAVAELIATFALTFVGAGAVLMTGVADGGLVGVALAHGLTLAIMVSIIGHISGGMVNPAVTIGLWVTGKLETMRTVVYVIAEVVGAVLGAATLKLVVPTAVFDAGHGGAPLVNSAAGMGVGKAVLMEAVLTFFLVFTVYGTAVDDRGPFAKTAGFTIGLVLTFDILAGGPLTGAAMNPARAIGPELISGTWTDWWVYWVGPIAGGIIAGVVYWGVFLRGRELATP
jgi:MIP family channel proteins